MMESRTLLLFVAFCSLALVEGFNFERDVLSHFRSKRQLKRVCSAELYGAPLNTICKTPPFMAHAATVAKCLTKLGMKSLADGEPICVFDCVYQENKWVSAAGVLDWKKIDADFTKALDATWKPVYAAAMKTCAVETNKRLTAKLSSGYVTKCKAGAYMIQHSLLHNMYSNCPAALRSPSYAAAKNALVACDAFAPTKTAAELASGAMGALKGIDTKSVGASLAGQDPKALLAKLPPSMAAMIPKGMDMNSPQAKALMANPGALAGKLPAGFNLAALLGRR